MQIGGKGSLRERSKGVWIGRFNLGPDPERPGKYLYSPSRTFHCLHEWEARKMMEEYRTELEGMETPQLSPATLAGYCDSWLALRKDASKSPRTTEREQLDVRHLKELFPSVKLKQLTAPIIQTAFNDARAEGRFDKELYHLNKRLRQILDSAVDDGLIKKNPARKISIPRPEPEPKDYLDPERLALFNEAVLALPWCGEKAMTLILLHTGIRPGEGYALSWGSCSFAECRLDIRLQYSNDMQLRKPKSKASEDWVVMDSVLWAYLMEWKAAQKEQLAQLAIEQTPETPIASNAFGGRFDPTNFGRWFRNFCVDTGFGSYSEITKTFTRNGREYVRGRGYKGLCPNMFRDIQATMMVGQLNVDPRTLQARMRHSDPSISLRYYTHPVIENEYQAAENFASLLEDV